MPLELDAAAIDAGARTLGLALDEGQLHRLADFARLLQRWNRVHNLTSIRGEDLLTHHLLDSLAMLPHCTRLAGESFRALDVGSGGGLPGIVLAVALPAARFTLAEAVQKKCAFLTQAALELGLSNVEVWHGRAEKLRAPAFDIITCRALASLAQFATWTRHVLKPAGRWLALKGRVPDQELAQLPTDIRAQVFELRVPGLDEQRHLVEMRFA